MTISRLYILENATSYTKVFDDFLTNEGIFLKGFKLVMEPTGLFVGAPSEKGEDDKWRETVAISKEMIDEIDRMVVNEYDRLRTSNSSSPAKEPEEESDLPF